MTLDARVIAGLQCRIGFDRYIRVTPWAHRRHPLGMGYGRTRFASPNDSFRLLYVGQTLDAGVAEAIIRDRFEGMTQRTLIVNELAGWGACEVRTIDALALLDLRGAGCFELGISTDIAGGNCRILRADLARPSTTRRRWTASSTNPGC